MTVLLWPDPGGGEDPWAGMVVRARFRGQVGQAGLVHELAHQLWACVDPLVQPELRGYVDNLRFGQTLRRSM